jgi:hypothetical protein
MNIGLFTDAPKHNLALMKISTYHKERGDAVYFNFPLMPCDRTYLSLLFSDSVVSGRWYGDVVGGPAFSDRNVLLPADMERCAPDLDLFGVDYSIGYSFRPCYRNCEFCKVGTMAIPDSEHHSIFEFHDRTKRKICLLNNNTFMDSRWKETFEEIWSENLTVVDENGYDVRLVDEEKADALKKTKWSNKLHFAWDRMKDEAEVVRGATILRNHKVRGTFYVLVGYDTTEEEDIHRCQVLKDLGFDFYIMPYGGTRQGKMFKRFVDLFMWRKYKTISEAWYNYEPRAHVLCAERLPDIKEAQPETAGRTLAGIAPTTAAASPLKCCHTCGEYGAGCEHPRARYDGCEKWIETF